MSSSASQFIGLHINGFEVVAKLHDNGSTAIFVMEKELESRALKVSLQDEADNLIHHEEAILKQFNHPAIVKLFGSVTLKGRPALILERLYGDLSERLPLNNTQAIFAVKRIYSALKVVHAAGFVHLDIKPENICLNEDNLPTLVDFGLACPLNTRLDPATGSMEYMAPERESTNNRATIGLDLYALGITAFEMLYDAYPMRETHSNAVSFPHAPPKALVNKINRWLDPIPENRIKKTNRDQTESFTVPRIEIPSNQQVSSNRKKIPIHWTLTIIGMIIAMIWAFVSKSP